MLQLQSEQRRARTNPAAAIPTSQEEVSSYGLRTARQVLTCVSERPAEGMPPFESNSFNR